VALALEDLGVPVRIVSQSPFAEGLERILGCVIEFIPFRRWERDLAPFVASLRPRLMVLDSFPVGLRQEWRGGFPPGLPLVMMARRLKLKEYLESHPPVPEFHAALLLESLDPEHRSWVEQKSQQLEVLPARVRLPLGLDLLGEAFDGEDTGVVVHSGPPEEVEPLLRQARMELEKGAATRLVLVSPVPFRVPGVEHRECYPAARLYAEAAFVVTGGGYNSVAEGLALARKHIAIPFPRRWDDQFARVRELTGTKEAGSKEQNGLGPAAEALARWWQDLPDGSSRGVGALQTIPAEFD
jgi:hypothetical protein